MQIIKNILNHKNYTSVIKDYYEASESQKGQSEYKDEALLSLNNKEKYDVVLGHFDPNYGSVYSKIKNIRENKREFIGMYINDEELIAHTSLQAHKCVPQYEENRYIIIDVDDIHIKYDNNKDYDLLNKKVFFEIMDYIISEIKELEYDQIDIIFNVSPEKLQYIRDYIYYKDSTFLFTRDSKFIKRIGKTNARTRDNINK